jgi:glutamine amidotransferase
LITILDYGINNLSSVRKAVAYLGFEAQIRSDLQGATKLIIPGVGAFGKAMEHLRPLRDEIRAFSAAGNPLLGIC